jgi:N-acetylmuramoyl-L-alanine amidase
MAVRRKSILIFFALFTVAALTHSAYPQTAQAPEAAAPGQAASQTSPQPLSQTNSPPEEQAPPPRNSLSVVILDPGHGGADMGAHGASGISESDVVLSFARLMRISLEGQGLRVVMTRQANENPSFDDRSKLANAQRGSIFITLHVSSTGQPGTARVYSLPQDSASTAQAALARSGLVPWDRAQYGFLDSSRRLAEFIQIQMAQRFRGSPEIPLTAAVRQLRTVAAPAVAIEISSVSLPERKPLDQMGPALADGVARAVAAFRTIYDSGGK